ncbi:MAG: hypothetical protein ACFFFG_16445, partial [Candidatus Thorarchaeota archaeon]
MSVMRHVSAMQGKTGVILLVLIVSLVLVSITVRSRTNDPDSQPEWDPPESFEVTAMVQTTDGGFALAGGTKSHAAWCGFCAPSDYEGGDMLLLKTDANGVMTWNQSYGGPYLDVPSALIQTTDGGFALAGITNVYGIGGSDFWLVKVDAHGMMTWNQSYGGPNLDVPSGLVRTTDGEFVLAGSTELDGAGNWDMWLVKTDDNGKEEWNHTYGKTESDGAKSVIETVDGGFALAGWTWSFGNEDMWLVKTDASGNVTWKQTIPQYGYAGHEDIAYALVQTTDGGFALAGSTNRYFG